MSEITVTSQSNDIKVTAEPTGVVVTLVAVGINETTQAQAAAAAAAASEQSAADHDASSATHDTAAAASAAAALTSEQNAATHETNAAAHDASSATHDTAAAASAAAALTSEQNAATHETNAAAHDTSSATHDTNSAASAVLAQNWATKTDAEVVVGQGYGAKKYAQDAAASAATAQGAATGTVRFDIVQALTAGQKTQAQSNLGLGYFATGTDAANLTGTLASARLAGAYSGITALGVSVLVGAAGSGTGGNFRYISDDGVTRWFTGILGSIGAKAFSIFDIAQGATRLSIDATTGALTVSSSTSSTSPSNGALVVAAGLGVGGAGNFGGNVNVSGDFNVAGFTGLGHIPGNTDRLLMVGVGTTSSTWALRVFNQNLSKAIMFLRDDGVVNLSSTYDNTSASAANIFIDAQGNLFRSTSSLRYKDVVGPYTKGMAAVRAMRPLLFKAKNGDDTIFAGFGAEHLHDADLTEFVGYDKNGRPDEVRYGHVTAALASGLQEIEQRLAALEAKH
jgi:hypothetical protein